ncbi:MAG: phosphopantothenoylcysteine decarboxylase [Opitutales bacterium]|nr:phosphopantothenoylcysteine decarboxylase [Opitutales bacterium]MCH8540345.1 phosphopantothenoylcysteine decarboxylase [Opitutales bacterium]
MLQVQGKKILINAGPTREFLDPVRYLSNGSSGKMGYALAEAAKAMGAEVYLVSGPVALNPPDRVKTVPVVTGEEMFEAMSGFLDQADWIIGCAAIADLAPVSCGEQKIKIDKETGKLTIELHPTRDIIATLASQRRDGQVFIGFAAETQNVDANAKSKLIRKGLDYIVANDVSQNNVGMNADQNAVQIYAPPGLLTSLGPTPKHQIAKDILRTIAKDIKK